MKQVMKIVYLELLVTLRIVTKANTVNFVHLLFVKSDEKNQIYELFFSLQ